MLGALMYAILHITFNFARMIGWFRLSIEGLELLPPREQSGMVVVMNHINWVDIPVIGTLLPYRYRLSWLAKSELFENPVMRWWFNQMRVISIRRGKRDTAAMGAVVAALRGGAALLIFPEGTRNRAGILQAGRGGAVRMAMQAEVPIVPLAIIGTEVGLKGVLRRGRVHLRIGAPYYVPRLADETLHPEQMDQLTTAMMGHIAALLPAERRGIYASLVEGAAEPRQ